MFRPFLLYDSRGGDAFRQALEPYGEPVALPPYRELPLPVQGHPDLLVFPLEGALYTYEGYWLENQRLFGKLGCPVVPLALPAGAYPLDLWFDGLPLCGRLLGRRGSLPEALTKKLTPLYIKQGYAHCSALSLGAAGVISADRSILEAAEALGVPCFRTEPAEILLPGYDRGFLGGASALMGQEVLFFGDLFTHPQAAEISSFLASRNYRIHSLLPGRLVDRGGLVVLFPPEQGRRGL